MAVAAELAVNRLEDKNKTLFTLFEKGYIVLKGEGGAFSLKIVVDAFTSQSLVSSYISRRLNSVYASLRRGFSYTRREVRLIA